MKHCKTYIDYIANLDSGLAAYINLYDKVYIYGAGRFGRAMLRYLEKKNCHIEGFVVTDIRNEPEDHIDQLPIVGFHEIEDSCRAGNVGIILSVSPGFRQEIIALLKNRGVVDAYIPSESLLEHIAHDCRTLTYDDAQSFMSRYPTAHISHVNISDWKRILIVSINNIGDIILQVPFLRELRANCGVHTKITMIVQPIVASFLRMSGYIDEIIVYDLKNNWAVDVADCEEKIGKFADEKMKGRHFDAVISLGWYYILLEQLFLSLMSGAPIRIAYSEHGFPEKSLYNKHYDMLLSLPVVSPGVAHEVEKNLHMLEVLNGKVQSSALEFWVSAADEKCGEDLLRKYKEFTTDKIIAVVPHANAADRMWDIKNYLKLLQRVEEYDNEVTFLIFGGVEAEYMAVEIERSPISKKVINLIGKTSVGSAAQILKKCGLYIGCNTGLLHIAAAWGIPTVEIIPHPKDGNPAEYTSPIRYRAWGNRSYVVRPRTALSGCGGSCYARVAHCINQITVDEAFLEVKKAFTEIWR